MSFILKQVTTKAEVVCGEAEEEETKVNFWNPALSLNDWPENLSSLSLNVQVQTFHHFLKSLQLYDFRCRLSAEREAKWDGTFLESKRWKLGKTKSWFMITIHIADVMLFNSRHICSRFTLTKIGRNKIQNNSRNEYFWPISDMYYILHC